MLKAWDILWDGEISAIVNAETIRNPFSKERKFLAELIKQHGEVEFVEGAFAVPEAERKTNVEVAIVYLRKQADVRNDIVGHILDDLKEEALADAGLGRDFREIHEVALPNTFVESTVLCFNAAVKAMRESVFATARSNHYAAMLGETMAVRNGDAATSSCREESTVAYVQGEIAKAYIELKDRAWTGILRSTNVTSRLSSAAQSRLESEFENIKQLEFTVTNIYGFLCGISENRGQIQIDMACDVFDLITRHTDNTVYFKGWRSNDHHRTCGRKIKMTRFVLPGHGTESYHGGMRWESERLLSDFDKVFAMLDGKVEPEVSLLQVCRSAFSSLRHGSRESSSYFDIRYYPGAGTIHFFPRDKKLIDRFNRLVGRHRHWLPPEDARVNEAFWLQYDKAEKFDKDLRSEVRRRAGTSRWWDNPFNQLSDGSEKQKEMASALIDEAMAAVLERNGIDVDGMLEAQPDLPLLAVA